MKSAKEAFGRIDVTQAALPIMRERKSGHILMADRLEVWESWAGVSTAAMGV